MASNPASHLVGLLLLLLSFWAIYERGYVDNDLVASRYEIRAKAQRRLRQRTRRGTGPAAVDLGRPRGRRRCGNSAPPQDGLCPAFCALGGGTGFNLRVLCVLQPDHKATRVWLYPLLQFARGAAFTVVVPIVPAGVAALGALALARWVPYQIYRRASAGWPNARPELMRLISFVLLSVMVVSCLGPSVLLTWSALALLLWNVFRARRDIYVVFSSARRLDRSARCAAAPYPARNPGSSRDSGSGGRHQGGSIVRSMPEPLVPLATCTISHVVDHGNLDPMAG